MNLKDLALPFPRKDIEWRVTNTNKDKTKGMIAAYVDARAIMDRLDSVCSPENWQVEYRHVVMPKETAVICRLSIRIGEEWISKEDGAEQTDYEAVKGGISSALRRAAVPWGISRYLYGLPNQWVEVVQRGTATYIADGVVPQLPQWALPENERGGRQAPPVTAPPPAEPLDDTAPTLTERLTGPVAASTEAPVGWWKNLIEWLPKQSLSIDSEEVELAVDGRSLLPDTALSVIQEWMDSNNADLGVLKTRILGAKRDRARR